MGINAAIMLGEIIDKFCYFDSKGLLNDGWFYLTIEDVEERTTLSRECQDGAIRILKDWGFIATKQMGMPAKRHFKIFKEKITEWVKPTNKIVETHKQECGNPTNMDVGNPQPSPIYKNPDEDPKIKLSCPPSESGTTEGPSFEIAKDLWDQILKIHPNHKPPDLQDWSKTIEKCHRIDKRSWDDLKSVIRFAFEQDPFWVNTLQSAEGLRKHFDKIWRKMKPATNNGSRQEANLKKAHEVKSLLSQSNEAHLLTIHTKSVSRQSGDSISFDLPPETFEEILMKWFELRPK